MSVSVLTEDHLSTAPGFMIFARRVPVTSGKATLIVKASILRSVTLTSRVYIDTISLRNQSRRDDAGTATTNLMTRTGLKPYCRRDPPKASNLHLEFLPVFERQGKTSQQFGNLFQVLEAD